MIRVIREGIAVDVPLDVELAGQATADAFVADAVARAKAAQNPAPEVIGANPEE